MQSDLGRQKRDKSPLISSVPQPTVSFCRLQEWFQAGNSIGWAASSTGIPWSIWEPCPLPELAARLLPTPFGRLPGCPEPAPVCPYCNGLLPHILSRLNWPWKRSPYPPSHASHLPQCNPAALIQSRTHNTWTPGCKQTGRAVGLRLTSACGSEALHVLGEISFCRPKTISVTRFVVIHAEVPDFHSYLQSLKMSNFSTAHFLNSQHFRKVAKLRVPWQNHV